MGEGAGSCGLTIKAVNDLRSENCQFQLRQGQSQVFPRDIGQASVIAGIHSACPLRLWSCQGSVVSHGLH